MKQSIRREYLRHELWEEVAFNMWGDSKESDKENSLKIMKDYKLWGSFMLKVVKEWKNSCIHNLTNTSQNRIAWIGQAAIALAIKCPEFIVRGNWSNLTKDEQDKANIEAQNAINYWLKNYEQN